MMKIGFLEDDRMLALLYSESFKRLGFESSGFASVASLISCVSKERFDLLLLDWSLPDGNAETAIKWVRNNLGWEIPIIVVSATDTEKNIVHALQLGADDYVCKPVRVDELVARVQALFRRSSKRPAQLVISYPPYGFDIRENTITVNGAPVSLTHKEFDLAFFLFENAGKLVSRVKILDKVWGHAGEIETRTIDAHVSKLKKKLGIDPQNGWKISTVYGYGYRLEKCSALDVAPSSAAK